MKLAVEKTSLEQLAIFGGEPLFAVPRSTSNLVRPEFARFLAYAEPLHGDGGEGEIVELMQRRFAAFHDVAHCIAFSNGFWALASTIKALALPGRSEIVMPSLTYRRMADVAAWAQLKPRFCEVDANSLAASPRTVAPCLGPDTALVLGVHPIVNCCDAPGLTELARSHGLPILFDSVESVYEYVAGRKIGGFGDAECFSLHASKLINGFEGGYVTTNDARLAERLAMARNLGRDGTGTVAVSWGLNARLSGLHAAMALAGLDGLSAQVAKNRTLYEAYRRTLSSVRGVRLVAFHAAPTSFKNVLVEVTEEWPLTRAETIALLNSEGALARAYYHPPLHRKKMSYPHVPADLPVTDVLAERFVLMPCGHFVEEHDVERIVALLAFVAANAIGIAARLRARKAA